MFICKEQSFATCMDAANTRLSISRSKVCRHAQVAEFCPGHFPKRGDLASHLIEQTFNARRGRFARNEKKQFGKELCLWPGIAWRFDRLPKPLEAALYVCEGAAFLGGGATGQNVMSNFGGFVWQHVADDECVELAQQIRSNAMTCHIFAKYQKGFDPAKANAVGDFWKIGADGISGDADESGPKAIRITVRV